MFSSKREQQVTANCKAWSTNQEAAISSYTYSSAQHIISCHIYISSAYNKAKFEGASLAPILATHEKGAESIV